MDAHPILHPTDQTLSSFGLGKLDDVSAEAVDHHLEQCADCRKRVAEMSADSFLERVRVAQKSSGHSMSGQSRPGVTQSNSGRNAPAPPPANTLPPELAHHPDYELKRELGRGGMGVVYLAHNTLMGRDEVLKVMGRQIMERAGVPERFLREIRAVAKLRHPNIVTAYHATRLGESVVFAMEYVEGYDLAQLVKSQGPLTVALACNFVYQAALGLQHAHEEGLVHRDIKPSNLVLSRKGNKATVKVLDFGLAKATREEKVDGGLTSEGQALGTPDFIAPEQIVDAPSADIRADIYSLGGTLYYLLSGSPPFQANSLYDMYQAHISQNAAPLNVVRPDVPAELAALVAKMMAKDPARRFQTPAEVAHALTPFFKKGAVAFRTPKPDVSQADSPSADRTLRERVSPPAPRKTKVGGTATRVPNADEPTIPDGGWNSLIDVRETESAIAATPSVALAARPRWVWPGVAVGVLLFAFCALLFSGVLKVKTQEGVIVLEGVPQDAEIHVDGNKLTLAWPGSGKPLEIRTVPGEHKVEVKKDGFRVFGEIVRVTTDKSPEVTVRLEPLVVNPPAHQKQTEIEAKKAEEPKTSAVALPRSDLERIATGKWVRLVDSATVLSDPQKMKFENGILELNHTKMLFPKVSARDVILRAQVRKVFGQNVAFGVRCGAEGGFGAFFAGSDYGGDFFGIGKLGNPFEMAEASRWTDLADSHVGRKFEPDRFVEMAFAAIGDTLTLYVDGHNVMTVENNELASGCLRLSAFKGKSLFKEVEYQILDSTPISNPDRPVPEKQTELGSNEEEQPKTTAIPAPRSDLDRVATGKWVRLVDSNTVLSDPERMKFENGILELNSTKMVFPKISARDVIVRAKVRKVSGQNLGIYLRSAAEGGYGAWFAGSDYGGDFFGLGIGRPWKDLANSHIARRFEADEFFEMAFAAIGHTLTLYVDGTKVIAVKDNELASGCLRLSALNGRSLFKDVEYQILDSVPVSNPK